MSDSISNCVPRDATDSVVSLNTEYMYNKDGLELRVLEFGYSKDFGWCVYVMDDKPRSDKYNDAKRYKTSELYVNRPPKSNVQCAIQDLNKLKLEVVKLGLNIYFGMGKSNVLFEMAKQIETDLLAIIRKLENPDAE